MSSSKEWQSSSMFEDTRNKDDQMVIFDRINYQIIKSSDIRNTLISFRLDTIEKLAAALVEMKKQLRSDKKLFREIYRFAFTFSLEADSRVICIQHAYYIIFQTLQVLIYN